MEKAIIGRFAPTPSGRLHLGNIFAAMLAYLSVKSKGGRCLLRVEDLDAARAKSGHITQMLGDLEWFGFEWDGETVYQSGRGDIYQKYFDELKSRGLIYPCYCSRGELAAMAPHGSDGQVLYSGRCRNLALPLPDKLPCYRIVCAGDITFTDGLQGNVTQNLETECTDFIVRRADGVFAYQLAVVVDDALTGVTEVVRGADLLSSTPRQIYLQKLLGLDTPGYYHVPLLLNRQGRRLAKRDESSDLSAIRKRYSSPDAVLGLLAHAAGLTDAPGEYSLADLVPIFSWDKIDRKNIILHTNEKT